jgi:hypothetical protein
MSFQDNNYVVLKTIIDDQLRIFISGELRNLESVVGYYREISNDNANYNINDDGQVTNCFYYYSPLCGETLSGLLKPAIESVVNKELLATYSYLRIYTNGAELLQHKDRESCEYSVVICVENFENIWNLNINDLSGNTIPILLNNGDALVYKGMEIEHWRNKFIGNKFIVLALHYVDKNGIYKDWMFDKRPLIGFRKQENNYYLNSKYKIDAINSNVFSNVLDEDANKEFTDKDTYNWVIRYA